jgi:predicted DNA-binding protein
MAISLRLSKQLEERLDRAASLAGVSKSEFMRRCLEKELESDENRPSAYELGKDLFGGEGSGRGDLARNAKKIVKEIIREKARRRRHGTTGRAV